MSKYGYTKGFVVAIGGAEDRTHDRTILKQLVRLNWAEHIVIIPTATSYPIEAAEEYQAVFHDLGVRHVDALDIRYNDEADRARYVDMLDDADIVFFTGGDQVKLVDVLNRSRVLQKIRDRHAEGMTIVGTSAGAAVIGDPVIYNGDYEGFNKLSVEYTLGFGFLPDLIIDTHFIERERIPRVCQVLASGRVQKGIGLAEDTAIIVAPDNTFEVVGSRIATVFSSNNLSYTNYHEIEAREYVTVDGVNVGFLAPGTTFDMETWSVIKQGAPQNLDPALSFDDRDRASFLDDRDRAPSFDDRDRASFLDDRDRSPSFDDDYDQDAEQNTRDTSREFRETPARSRPSQSRRGSQKRRHGHASKGQRRGPRRR